ncbi:MAG: gephyrin-like molybdotransferase Glp [Myxococcota bacterium]|mgnify:CR=1 FL=1
MISLDEALRRILTDIEPLGVEEVPLDEAPGRVLARDVRAGWDLPPFDNSAMDGYAVRAADVAGAARDAPARLRVVGRLFAGDRAETTIAPRESARIMTGAPLPPGADAVVRQEATAREGAVVAVHVGVETGENVRRRGEDARVGQLLLRAGDPIDAAAVAVLASLGCATVQVARRPRVAILAIGDELVPVERATAGVVVDSNSHVCLAIAREAGAEARRLGIAPDEPAAVTDRLREAAREADVLVTVAGASVGERDPVRAALEALGVEIGFWGLAIKPGKPTGFGHLGERLVFALPGNPAAAALVMELVVRPALLALQGARAIDRPRLRARLDDGARKQPGLAYFLRGHLRFAADGPRVKTPPRQGSGQVTPALGANAIVVLPRGRGEVAAGDAVEVLLVGSAPTAPALPPTICFVGPSGVGKTTLLERLIPRLCAARLRVAAVKHDAHEFETDHEGKDTWRLRRAGARIVAISSPTQFAVMGSVDRPLALDEVRARVSAGADLVLVEGWKNGPGPKIEVHRAGIPLLHASDGASGFIAVVTDDASMVTDLPSFGPDDIEGIAGFLLREVPKAHVVVT